MKRITILAAAGALVATPALGAWAAVAATDDGPAHDVSHVRVDDRRGEPEPGDDRGRHGHAELLHHHGHGADDGATHARHRGEAEPRDDRGQAEPEPGDDHGGQAEPEPGDDHGDDSTGPSDHSGSDDSGSDDSGSDDHSGSGDGHSGSDDGSGDDGGHHGGGDDDAGHH
jgi:hypothetical protein